MPITHNNSTKVYTRCIIVIDTVECGRAADKDTVIIN